MTVVVRRLGPGDERDVERFADAFDDPLDLESTRRFLHDPRHHLLVAEIDGEPAGFTSATEILHPDKPPELFLNEIGVVDHLRRRGAAHAMLRELGSLGRELGCATIWVLTDEGNPAAMAAYGEAGGVWDGARHVMFEIDLRAE